MSDHLTVTDEAIRAAFSRRSTIGSSTGLASAISAQTSQTAQRTSWPGLLGVTRNARERMSRMILVVGGSAVVVVLAAVGIAFLASPAPIVVGPPVATPSPQPTASPRAQSPTAEQMSGIDGLVDAVNNRDAHGFTAAFVPDGAFDPRGTFRGMIFASSLEIRRLGLVQPWMEFIAAWDLEAEILACALEDDPVFRYADSADAVVRCEVATRWHTLSLEVVESWRFELEGSRVWEWDYTLLDLDPVQRALPLGYQGIEAWEAWLEANRPTQAALYLNPRTSPGPGEPDSARLYSSPEHDWSISGHDFTPDGFLPWDPADADEIQDSINEYLETRP